MIPVQYPSNVKVETNIKQILYPKSIQSLLNLTKDKKKKDKTTKSEKKLSLT
jgi:hypothetical protein